MHEQDSNQHSPQVSFVEESLWSLLLVLRQRLQQEVEIALAFIFILARRLEADHLQLEICAKKGPHSFIKVLDECQGQRIKYRVCQIARLEDDADRRYGRVVRDRRQDQRGQHAGVEKGPSVRFPFDDSVVPIRWLHEKEQHVRCLHELLVHRDLHNQYQGQLRLQVELPHMHLCYVEVLAKLHLVDLQDHSNDHHQLAIEEDSREDPNEERVDLLTQSMSRDTLAEVHLHASKCSDGYAVIDIRDRFWARLPRGHLQEALLGKEFAVIINATS
mmetsp:Transcript_101503/g.327199  ORF Transcript_101503/g.327199 Transcript_101503/m.327199 type:complete len:274 (+) Transcript_101503:585-1406(+)